MIKRFLLFFFLYSTSTAHSSNDNRPIGARSAGIANASVSLSDLWSVHHNQAGLAFVKKYTAGTYFENRFLLKELSLKAGVVAIPIKAGTFGVSFTNFGYSLYSENKYNISFAKAFGEHFSVGVAMNYISTNIAEGYGKKGVAVAEIGLLSKPIENLSIGFHLYNPTRTLLTKKNNERLPTIIRLGGHYTFSEKVLFAIESEKDIGQKTLFKAGIEYKPVQQFYLRVGISTHPNIQSFGFGIHIKSLKVDFAATYNQLLGINPQLSLQYEFSK